MSQAAEYVDNQTLLARIAAQGWLLISLMILLAWLGVAHLAPLAPWRVGMYILQPLLWLIPAAIVLLLLGAGWRALRDANGLIPPALAVGLVQVALLVGAGFIFGFGSSPYGHSPVALLSNLWYVGVILVAREICRSFIVQSLYPRGEILAVGVTWLLLGLTALPFHGLSRLSQPESAFEFLGTVVLPLAAAGLLATYLALGGGPLASIAYLGVVQGFLWFSPLLPNLPWNVAALIGVLVPVVGLAVIAPGAVGNDQAEEADDEAEVDGLGFGWIAGGIFLLVLVWFNTGVFGVHPSIVNGNSMEPTMHTGDLAIIGRADPHDLEVGDVIKFRQGSVPVMHRIIEIHQGDESLVFIAQGDNNRSPDQPIAGEAVEGELVLHIPKAGLPALYFRRAIDAVTG